jgi:hypothetical protein
VYDTNKKSTNAKMENPKETKGLEKSTSSFKYGHTNKQKYGHSIISSFENILSINIINKVREYP